MGLGQHRTADATCPAGRAISVAYSDSAVLEVTRGLWVSAAGDVAVVMAGQVNGAAVTFKSVPAGTILPIQVTKVMATGTTIAASNVLALY